MIDGHPPWNSYEQILGAQSIPNLPNGATKELIHLIKNLLIKNPYHRLGTTANKRKGVIEIYQHQWFTNKMEWNALKAQKFPAPYTPQIQNDEDASNFEHVQDDQDHSKDETLYNNKSVYKWCEYF